MSFADQSARPDIVDVLQAISREEGTDVLDLPPLHGTIDPDAMERVLEETGVTVEFTYHGYRICISEQDFTVDRVSA